jgi:plastocyanin
MRRVIVTTAVLGALVVVGQAGAADYTMYLGEQQPCGFMKCPGAPANIPKGTLLDDFFPGRVTIVAGDRITFSSATFHTVSYVAKFPSLFMPTGQKYNGFDDAAGDPFWFNGRPKLAYNLKAFGPFGPKTISGKTPTSSGALSPTGPPGPNTKPATFTYSFPKAGTYKLICTIHPGMKATVVVKPAGTTAPLTPTQVSAEALAAENAAWTKAKVAAAAAKPPPNTVYAGVGDKATILAYFPKTLTIKVGTTVSFVNKSAPEPHNVVFGPKKYIEQLQKKTDLFPTGPTGPNQVAPALLYGSDPKGQYVYDGSNHGNGFISTQATADTPLVPLPKFARVTFTKAGTYKYFCWIHGPDMGGTITVTP